MGFIDAKTDWVGIAQGAYKQGVSIGADAFQNDKSRSVQQAIAQGRLKQRDDEFAAELQRKQVADETTATLRQRQADEQAKRTSIQKDNSETARMSAEQRAKSDAARNAMAQSKLDATTMSKEQQRKWIESNRPNDLDYFDAFGKLPGHDSLGFQTDPQTHALEQLRKDLENKWARAAKALKDAAVDPKDTIGLDASDSVPGARKGREPAYLEAVAKIAQLQKDHDTITGHLMKRHASVAGLDPNNYDLSDTPGGAPAPDPSAPMPQPQPAAGVQPGPAVALPKAPAMQQAAPAPAPAAAPAPQPAGVIPPEAKVEMLKAVAAERGVNPDAIKQLPAPPKSAVVLLVSNLRKTISDPNKLAAEIVRQLVMAGFDPMKPPLDDAPMAPQSAPIRPGHATPAPY